MNIYNQLLSRYSAYGCVPYGVGHIFLLDYGIWVENSFLLNVLKIAETEKVWDSNSGAIFETFYNWIVKKIDEKVGIKTKVVKTTIDGIKGTENAWGFGIKNANKSLISAFNDGIFTEDEAQSLVGLKGFGHHLVWKKGYIIDPYSNKIIKCSYATLKKMLSYGLIWNTFRGIEPAEPISAKILHYTGRMAIAESNKALDQYIETNKEQVWFDDAYNLYFYGREKYDIKTGVGGATSLQ